VANVGHWSRTAAMVVYLSFNFAVVFSPDAFLFPLSK
jgi:hypothetical protein